ncbi:MAG: hypothetical protein ACXVUE_22490 [Solirubrobacteraceae bacterium]
MALVPGELPPLEPDDGSGLTPPELELLVLVFAFAFGLCLGLGFGFGFGGAVDVLVVGGVLAVLDVAGGLAAPVVLLTCLEPPQPAIASAAINTPES